MPLTAANAYLKAREEYEAMCTAIDGLLQGEPALKKALKRACLAHVRRNFRGISMALTTRLGVRFITAGGTQAGAAAEKEHAVPLRLIHNRILGVRHNGTALPEVRALYGDVRAVADFVRTFVITVHVSRVEHGKLLKMTMPGGDDWNWDDEADGLMGPMGRYHLANSHMTRSDWMHAAGDIG